MRNRISTLSKLTLRKRFSLKQPMKLKVLYGVCDILGEAQSVAVRNDISFFQWKSKSVQVHDKKSRWEARKVSTASTPIQSDIQQYLIMEGQKIAE